MLVPLTLGVIVNSRARIYRWAVSGQDLNILRNLRTPAQVWSRMAVGTRTGRKEPIFRHVPPVPKVVSDRRKERAHREPGLRYVKRRRGRQEGRRATPREICDADHSFQSLKTMSSKNNKKTSVYRLILGSGCRCREMAGRIAQAGGSIHRRRRSAPSRDEGRAPKRSRREGPGRSTDLKRKRPALLMESRPFAEKSQLDSNRYFWMSAVLRSSSR